MSEPTEEIAPSAPTGLRQRSRPSVVYGSLAQRPRSATAVGDALRLLCSLTNRPKRPTAQRGGAVALWLSCIFIEQISRRYLATGLSKYSTPSRKHNSTDNSELVCSGEGRSLDKT